jgi:hypothetical protein
MDNLVRCRPTPVKPPSKMLKQLDRLKRDTERRITKCRTGLSYFPLKAPVAGDLMHADEASDRLDDVLLELAILRQLIIDGCAEHRIRAQMRRSIDVAAERFGEAERILDFARRLKLAKQAEYRRVWSEKRRQGISESAARSAALREAGKISWVI